MTENTLLISREMVYFGDMNADAAWDQAIDATDYPVKIVPAFYQLRQGEFAPAEGKTVTARNKHFNLVLVNKYRREGDDAFECISAVTGQYGTLSTSSIYRTFREQLDEIRQPNHPVNLYVSGNGGIQRLLVAFDGMDSLTDVPDNLAMRVCLHTSLDGTHAHTLTLDAYNKTGNINVAVYGGEYQLHARHTTTIKERTVEFIPFVQKLVASWNTVIIPMMKLIYDEKFNREVALQTLRNITERAGIGQRHTDEIVALYESGSTLFTNDMTDSLYRVYTAINYYIGKELDEKPESQERFRGKLAVLLGKEVKRLRSE